MAGAKLHCISVHNLFDLGLKRMVDCFETWLDSFEEQAEFLMNSNVFLWPWHLVRRYSKLTEPGKSERLSNAKTCGAPGPVMPRKWFSRHAQCRNGRLMSGKPTEKYFKIALNSKKVLKIAWHNLHGEVPCSDLIHFPHKAKTFMRANIWVA